MISSFFSKTKPINYLVLSLFLLVFYISNFFLTQDGNSNIFFLTVVLAVILSQTITLQEIVRLRKITNITTYAMLFFVLLCMAIPKVIYYKEVVFCNLFLILAINSLLSLNSLKRVKQKIFDASLWICVASIFDPLALLFLFVVFLAVYIYGTKEYKNWLVPFVAVTVFSILLSTFLVVTKNLAFFQNHYTINLEDSFAKSFYENFSIKPFIYIAVMLCLIIVVFIKQSYQGVGRIVHLRMLLVYFLISLLIFIAQTSLVNNYMTLLYSFFPAAIFATNFLETVKRKRIKEWVLVACVLFPFVLLFISLIKR